MPLSTVPPEELRDSQEAFRQFRAACARAFAGTRWKPHRYVAQASGPTFPGLRYVMELRLELNDLLEVVPEHELFPRSAACRDPRFHLRRWHASRQPKPSPRQGA